MGRGRPRALSLQVAAQLLENLQVAWEGAHRAHCNAGPGRPSTCMAAVVIAFSRGNWRTGALTFEPNAYAALERAEKLDGVTAWRHARCKNLECKLPDRVANAIVYNLRRATAVRHGESGRTSGGSTRRTQPVTAATLAWPAHYPARLDLVRGRIGAYFGHEATTISLGRGEPVSVVDISTTLLRSAGQCLSTEATVLEALFAQIPGQRVRDHGLLVLRKQLEAVGGRAVVDVSEARRLWRIYKGPKYGRRRRVITGSLPTIVTNRAGSLATLEACGTSVVARRLTVSHFEVLMEAQRGRIRGVPTGSTDAKMRKLWAQSIHQRAGGIVGEQVVNMVVAAGWRVRAGAWRFAEAGAGFGGMAAAVESFLGGDFKYVFAAEAQTDACVAHAGIWAATVQRVFGRMETEGTVALMVKMGKVDIWHFSPRCAVFSRRRWVGREWRSRQRKLERRWLEEVRGTMEYVRLAQPTAVTIENVPQLFSGGAHVWLKFRRVLAALGDYSWSHATFGPEASGSQAVRRRLWVFGVLRRPSASQEAVGRKRKR